MARDLNSFGFGLQEGLTLANYCHLGKTRGLWRT